MKILLVGDYSGVHSELARALRSLGHSVIVLSDGDGYKNFERDIDLGVNKKSRPPQSVLRSNFIVGAISKSNYWLKRSKLFSLVKLAREFAGLRGVLLYFRRRNELKGLRDFDVVQLINPMAIESFGPLANLMFIRFLKKNNKSLFLCALGDDRAWVNFCLEGGFKYSPLDEVTKKNFHLYSYSLRYKYGIFFKMLHEYCIAQCIKIIPGLYDYKMAYDGNDKCVDIVPLPISGENFSAPEITSYPVKIFHGWQAGKESRKGNLLIHEAVLRLVAEVGDDIVEYRVVKSVPFEEYKKLFRGCDILMDQCFSYDRGVNGALGMCAGKVVFSGFEPGSVLVGNETVGVNAGQTSEAIYLQLKELICNLPQLNKIKANAYSYACEVYAAESVAKKYLAVWGLV